MVNYHHSGTSDDPVTEELDDDDHALDMTSGGVENDQFARYLCQQISNDLPDKFGIAEDDDDDDDTDSLWTGDFMRSPFSQMKYQQNDSFTSTSTRQSFAEVEEDSDEDSQVCFVFNRLFWNHSYIIMNLMLFSQKQDTNPTAVTASTTQALLTPADWTANFEAAFNGGTDSTDISSTVASFTAPLESSSDDDDDDENDGEGGDDDTAELPTGKEQSTS
ncbi:hypothetical protein BKA69DRAFT_474152 [Paraphysoderma sedebokerense]|nr:hypothetical protein BKA69DRAFT_474152 [Paraphysoderma sedebokerense]